VLRVGNRVEEDNMKITVRIKFCGFAAVASSLNVSGLSFSTFPEPTFKKPKALPKKKVAKPLFSCDICRKGYVSTSYFKNHKLTHKVQGKIRYKNGILFTISDI